MNTPEKRLLDRLYGHVAAQPITPDVSLLGGQMGFALFEAYYQRYAPQPLPDPAAPERIFDRVAASLDAIQAGELIHSFAGGIAGVAWGFLHLCNQGLLTTDDLDAHELVEGLDEPLFEISLDLLKQNNWDYLHGGLGVCLYYLERRPSPVIAQYVEALVEQLAATAVRFPDGGITWLFDEFGRRDPNEPPLYNLGLSHGMASIVATLCLLYERGYARARCAELIGGAVNWLWTNRNRAGLSVFPNMVGEVHQDQESRLAWCYGDLGIANTFWLAGQTLAVPDWQTIARDTMQKATTRRDPAETRMLDASLCHGSAGAAHLFRRFANRFGDVSLHQTADYWRDHLFQQVQPLDQKAVLLFKGTDGLSPNLSLLDGETSVGMVLLSELGAPTSWNRLLLLS